MAERTSITPILPGAEDPAAGAPCAHVAELMKTQAAARAAVRIIVVCRLDPVRVNILEFTFFSLLWVIPAKPQSTWPILEWLKLVLFPLRAPQAFDKPRSIAEPPYLPQSETFFYSADRSLLAAFFLLFRCVV
jgi:hypothetical protein